MSAESQAAEAVREPLLSPVDRVSELLFGLFMALTFTGAVSIADSGRDQIREMFIAAFGCNIAWGLVDAVMYLVRTVADRGKTLTLVRSVREAPDAQTGCTIIAQSMSRTVALLLTATEIEAARRRIVALPSLPARPKLKRVDLLAALAIFLIVVASTIPVVLPFVFIQDIGTAKNVSRAIALAMLFFGGLALGRYAGYGSFKVGFMMVGVGSALVVAITLLGG
jgi:hypothetical protein